MQQQLNLDARGIKDIYDTQHAGLTEAVRDAARAKDAAMVDYMQKQGITQEAFQKLTLDQKKAFAKASTPAGKAPWRWTPETEARAWETIGSKLPKEGQ